MGIKMLNLNYLIGLAHCIQILPLTHSPEVVIYIYLLYSQKFDLKNLPTVNLAKFGKIKF